MKKTVVIFLLIISLACFNCAVAQTDDVWKRFSLGASYMTSANIVDNNYNGTSHFQGVVIEGTYRLKLYRSLMLHPGISVFYLKLKPMEYDIWLSSKPPGSPEFPKTRVVNDEQVNGVGIDIVVPVGFHFTTRKMTFDVETGPIMNLMLRKIYQHDLIEEVFEDGEIINRRRYNYLTSKNFCLGWRLAASAGIRMGLYVKLAYDLMMTDYIDTECLSAETKKPGVFSVGLGYNF